MLFIIYYIAFLLYIAFRTYVLRAALTGDGILGINCGCPKGGDINGPVLCNVGDGLAEIESLLILVS